MAGKRKVHTAGFKAQGALAAVRERHTVNELAGQYGIHPTLIHGGKKQLLARAEEGFEAGVHPTLIQGWKKAPLAGAEEVFESGAKAAARDVEQEQAALFEQIGRLKMELEWVKKKAAAFG